MTDPNLTHIIYILDRSGSMYLQQEATISAFDEYINSQKNEPGRAELSVTLFDNEITHPIQNVDIAFFNSIRDYYTIGGTTALHDAIGSTLNERGAYFASLPEDQRPSKVLCIIHTDGMENSSREFTSEDIKDMINRQTNDYNWQFIFLGEDQDAWTVANNLGISNSVSLDKSAEGLSRAYNTLAKATSSYRVSEGSSATLDVGQQDLRQTSTP